MKVPLILADVPWPYYGDQTKMGAAGNHYKTMTIEELEALPIRALLEDKGALLLWTTGPKLPEAVALIKAWGLHYRNVAYVWVKINSAGEIIGAQGPPATMVKQNAEYVILASVEDEAELVLLATSNKAGRPFPIQDFAHAQVVKARKGAHSAKPEIFHEKIEKVTGSIAKLELFARAPREGWTCVGDGIDGRDINAALKEFIAS